MSVVRVAFMGTPEFARYHLDHLLGDEHYKVVGVISQPDRPSGRKLKLQPSPVKVLAEEMDLPVITPERIGAKEIEEIRSWKAEVAVVVAFGQLLKQELLDVFPYGVVNVHGSLLPRWRGAAPIQRALMAGDKETGVCLQKMVLKLDAGDVLGARRIAIDDEMDAKRLHDAMMPLGADLLHIELMDYVRGHLTPRPQNESEVTYAKKILKDEGRVDWTRPAREIFNRYRGLTMGPGSFTLRGGKKLKLYDIQMANEAPTQPGQVLSATSEGVVVSCGQGSLRIMTLQPESRARMSAEEYTKGYAMAEGEILGE